MEILLRRGSITTPTLCLHCCALTDLTWATLIYSHRPERDFPISASKETLGISCVPRLLLFLEAFPPQTLQTVPFAAGIFRKGILGVLLCHPPSPTPTQGLKVHPSIHVGSERPVLLFWLMCTCSSTLWTLSLPGRLQHITPSTVSQREIKSHYSWSFSGL